MAGFEVDQPGGPGCLIREPAASRRGWRVPLTQSLGIDARIDKWQSVVRQDGKWRACRRMMKARFIL